MKASLLIAGLFWASFVPVFSWAQIGSELPAAVELANPPQPKPQTAFEQQLIDTEKMLLDAFLRGDAAQLNAAIADDFLSIGTNGDMGNKREVLASIHPGEGKPPAPILYDFRVIRLTDNAAIVAYQGIFQQHRERYQHLSDTWVKENGQWKLKFQQATLNLWSAHDL